MMLPRQLEVGRTLGWLRGLAPSCVARLVTRLALDLHLNVTLSLKRATRPRHWQAFIVGIPLHQAVDQALPLPRTTYVVVMTDGDDQGSQVSLHECCDVVRKINTLRDFKVRTKFALRVRIVRYSYHSSSRGSPPIRLELEAAPPEQI